MRWGNINKNPSNKIALRPTSERSRIENANIKNWFDCWDRPFDYFTRARVKQDHIIQRVISQSFFTLRETSCLWIKLVKLCASPDTSLKHVCKSCFALNAQQDYGNEDREQMIVQMARSTMFYLAKNLDQMLVEFLNEFQTSALWQGNKLNTSTSREYWTSLY